METETSMKPKDNKICFVDFRDKAKSGRLPFKPTSELGLGVNAWYEMPAYARKNHFRLSAKNRLQAIKYYATLLVILMLPLSATVTASESRCVRVYEIAGDIMTLRQDRAKRADLERLADSRMAGYRSELVEMMIVHAFAEGDCKPSECAAQLDRFADSWYEACERSAVFNKLER